MPSGRLCGWRDCSLELYGARTDGESEAVARARERSLASYAYARIDRVVAYPRSLDYATYHLLAVAAALISEADWSVTLRGSTTYMWRPRTPFHGYLENHIIPANAQPSGRAISVGAGRHQPSPSHSDCWAGSSFGCRCAPSIATSRSRTSAITRRVNSVIRRVAARCSAPSAGSMPSSCASASSAASGLFSWCWTRAIAFFRSLWGISGPVRAPAVAVSAFALLAEDDPADGSVTTDATRVPAIF